MFYGMYDGSGESREGSVKICDENISDILTVFLFGVTTFPKEVICDGDGETYCKWSDVLKFRSRIISKGIRSNDLDVRDLCKCLRGFYKKYK